MSWSSPLDSLLQLHRAVQAESLSPPLLKVPGASSLAPITCFIRAPILGCLSLSDESVNKGTISSVTPQSRGSRWSRLRVTPPTRRVHVCGCEATQRVSATVLTVRRHGADDGLEILLLLQTGGVGLRGHCTERRRSVLQKAVPFTPQHMLAWLQGTQWQRMRRKHLCAPAKGRPGWPQV